MLVHMPTKNNVHMITLTCIQDMDTLYEKRYRGSLIPEQSYLDTLTENPKINNERPVVIVFAHNRLICMLL